MLEQEGLSQIARSNASEQIAYLLVERTALLEKLEVAAQLQVPPLRPCRERAGKRASLRYLVKSKYFSYL